ncbi:hypothetical protein J6590_094396 [Homalodisca vitripennis]|nr:hypothetical protein J6590_094396 [Homalodisca vitripennis]
MGVGITASGTRRALVYVAGILVKGLEVGVTKECSWRRPIERIGQRDVATQQVSNSPARRAAVTARNKFGNVAYSSLAAPRSRSK